MTYKITTIQYGMYKDVVEHEDLDSLLHDLANIDELQSVEVLRITKNGRSVSVYKCSICGKEFSFSPEKNNGKPKECQKCRKRKVKAK